IPRRNTAVVTLVLAHRLDEHHIAVIQIDPPVRTHLRQVVCPIELSYVLPFSQRRKTPSKQLAVSRAHFEVRPHPRSHELVSSGTGGTLMVPRMISVLDMRLTLRKVPTDRTGA